MVIGMDLGGTKLSAAIIGQDGSITEKTSHPLAGKKGEEAGRLIVKVLNEKITVANKKNIRVTGVGIGVPGIYHSSDGHVWAPNIPGWDHYPLREELTEALKNTGLSIKIDSDRACCILGETWTGVARGSQNAVFLAVGTGIGAGILCNGRILRGNDDIAGAIGWMALTPDYDEQYGRYGCFEYHASGEGLVRWANSIISRRGSSRPLYTDSREIFSDYEATEETAVTVIENAIRYWGMASANLISLFNPEYLVFGGGIFGPAARFIDDIRKEAERWAQPVSFGGVRFCNTRLGGDAGLTGAGRLAMI
jgi:glucokinase